MSLLSPFAGLDYEPTDDDLVRFRDTRVDGQMSNIVRSIADSLEGHRDDVRRAFHDDDVDTLRLFARRRLLTALRTRASRGTDDALDAYALMVSETDVPWETWFKATLVVARSLDADLDLLRARFDEVAPPRCAQRAHVAFEAVSRVEHLNQCHVIEVTTHYGAGLLEATVVREANDPTWGGITAIPVSLGQYQVGYAPSVNLAQVAVECADALEVVPGVTCSSIRQEQLVATTFDLVTAGSYVDSLGCLGLFVDVAPSGPHFALNVAEVGSEDYDGVHYDAGDLAQELAEAADALEEQAAMAWGACVIVLSALPDFSEDATDEPVDLSYFLEVIRPAVVPPNS